jgi:CRISPR type III-A/MTUBE-associated protein Csm6
MDKKVLFTCVGSSDPVRDLHDGAMLHIIRHYLPQKVYIVLSAQMEKTHREDDRYRKAIRKFCRDYHHDIEVQFFPCGIEDVSDFDAFDELFRGYLKQIMQENPGAEILLNLSSGSPQMKITMCLLANDMQFNRLKAIQVKTYQGGANTSENTAQKDYDPDAQIELNEDNEPGAEDRCREPKIFTVKKALALQQVQALLRDYEYKSAKILLQSLGLAQPDSTAMILTEHLLKRQDLKTKEAEKLVVGRDYGMELFPIANVKCKELVEYFLVLQNLQKTGKITEFTLRLNPFIVRMQELYLQKRFCFDCAKIKQIDSHGIEFLKREKIEQADRALLEYLDQQFRKDFQDSHPSIAVYNHMLSFFHAQKGNEEDSRYLQFFKTCEQVNYERNSSAHSLYGMDESDLQPYRTSSKQILDTLKNLLRLFYGKECKLEAFELYDNVNALIMQSL